MFTIKTKYKIEYIMYASTTNTSKTIVKEAQKNLKNILCV